MITLAEAPSGTGVLGLLSTSSDNNAYVFTTAPVGTRSITNGTIKTTFFPGFSDGTLVGSLNLATGVWTAPATGWYNFTLLFTLSPDVSPFNSLTSATNPNGFVGNGAPPIPDYSILATPQTLSFNEYIGEFSIALTTIGGGTIICSNTQLVTYNTSYIVISASYTARYLVAGTQLTCLWLNKCLNTITGQLGNTYHFTATHIK